MKTDEPRKGSYTVGNVLVEYQYCGAGFDLDVSSMRAVVSMRDSRVALTSNALGLADLASLDSNDLKILGEVRKEVTPIGLKKASNDFVSYCFLSSALFPISKASVA